MKREFLQLQMEGSLWPLQGFNILNSWMNLQSDLTLVAYITMDNEYIATVVCSISAIIGSYTYQCFKVSLTNFITYAPSLACKSGLSLLMWDAYLFILFKFTSSTHSLSFVLNNDTVLSALHWFTPSCQVFY